MSEFLIYQSEDGGCQLFGYSEQLGKGERHD